MAFDKQHWNDPRATIATIYKDNDYGYVMHAALTVTEIERNIDLTPKELSTKTILDYGCGTGRMTMILSYKFLNVMGYDPVVNCITLAESDRNKVNFSCDNLKFTTDIASVEQYDYVCSVSVLEHLYTDDFNAAMRDIARCTKIGAVLWYSVGKNPNMSYFTNAKYGDFKGKSDIRVVYLTADELQRGIRLL